MTPDHVGRLHFVYVPCTGCCFTILQLGLKLPLKETGSIPFLVYGRYTLSFSVSKDILMFQFVHSMIYR